MPEIFEIPSNLSGSQLVQALNDRLRRISFLLTQMQGKDGQTAKLSGTLDMGGGQILNVGSGGDVLSRAELQADGLLLNPTSGTHVATRPIDARAGVRVPRATRPDEAVPLDQLGEAGGGTPADAAPPAVADASVLGVVTTQYALEDHSHEGLNRGTEQTATGLKHFDGGLSIGVSGPNITNMLSASVAWDPPLLAAGASSSTDVALAGTIVGDLCFVSFSTELVLGFIIHAHAIANAVRVQIFNINGVATDLGSGTVRVWVLKF